MPYIPNTDDDRRLMLDKIGVADIEDLLAPVSDDLRLEKDLDLPPPLSEMELLQEMAKLASRNTGSLTVYAGGGVYDHDRLPHSLRHHLDYQHGYRRQCCGHLRQFSTPGKR